MSDPRREREEKEFGDLVYDVWRSGGDPDRVDRDRFEGYDFYYDEHILRDELRRQHPREEEPEQQEQEEPTP